MTKPKEPRLILPRGMFKRSQPQICDEVPVDHCATDLCIVWRTLNGTCKALNEFQHQDEFGNWRPNDYGVGDLFDDDPTFLARKSKEDK